MEKPASARRERKDAQQNLKRVLEAAHALFAERGPDVTMEEVARRAGVGVGTVYRRFPSKEHLLAAVCHTICADTQQHLHQATQAARDPVGKIRALVLVQYHHSSHQPALLDPHTAHGGAAVSEQQQLYSTLHALLRQVIAEGQVQGHIREGDSGVLAALCLELLNPRALHNLMRQTDARAEEAAEHVLRFVLEGLGVR